MWSFFNQGYDSLIYRYMKTNYYLSRASLRTKKTIYPLYSLKSNGTYCSWLKVSCTKSTTTFVPFSNQGALEPLDYVLSCVILGLWGWQVVQITFALLVILKHTCRALACTGRKLRQTVLLQTNFNTILKDCYEFPFWYCKFAGDWWFSMNLQVIIPTNPVNLRAAQFLPFKRQVNPWGNRTGLFQNLKSDFQNRF